MKHEFTKHFTSTQASDIGTNNWTLPGGMLVNDRHEEDVELACPPYYIFPDRAIYLVPLT